MQATINQPWLKIVTCGSVDDGKSTLLGRLIAHSQALTDDQWQQLQRDSERIGKAGKGNIDYSLLVDGLEDEVAQGITIDVAYRYFSTKTRKFMIADSPGHVQYTRNMVTAVSNAQIALLLVDAQAGIVEQTRRHLYILNTLGIAHICIAINKMDLVEFSEQRFNQLADELASLANDYALSLSVHPVAARDGDGVASDQMQRLPWWQKPSLLEVLNTLDVAHEKDIDHLWIQGIVRPDEHFRGYSGQWQGSTLSVGERLQVWPSQTTTTVKSLSRGGNAQTHIASGEDALIECHPPVDIARGDVLTRPNVQLELLTSFTATIIWMSESPLRVGRRYRLRIGTRWSDVSVTKIETVLDVDTLQMEASDHIGLNDIAKVHVHSENPLPAKPFTDSAALGRFILTDKIDASTVAGGLIIASQRRNQRLSSSAAAKATQPSVTNAAKLIWLTGLPKSGKSALAQATAAKLQSDGKSAYVLDFANVRLGINRDLGFSDDDRVEHLRRVAEISKLFIDAGVTVITAFVSPFVHEREAARQLVGEPHFVEVHLDTPIDICRARDSEGQYGGTLQWVPGLNSRYDIPTHPSLRLSAAEHSPEELAEQLVQHLGQRAD